MEINPILSGKAKRDFELVKKARDGDEAAFTELLDIYKDRLYYFVLMKVKNPVDAEDIAMETLGKAFKNLSHYQPRNAFSSWVYQIAINNCTDYFRKKKHKHLSLENIINDDEGNEHYNVASDMLDPEERLIKEQKAELLKTVVQTLKPRYSTLIRYRYFKEMSYKEIAKKMNVPIGTVKARLYRSRELLRAILHAENS